MSKNTLTQETQPKPEAGLSLGAAPCSACGGDGIETCDNPDHALIDAVGGETGRLGCPCCGHHPRHKMRWPCPECNGTGITPNAKSDLCERSEAK